MGRRSNNQQQRARGGSTSSGGSSRTTSTSSTASSKGVELVSEENFERMKQACADCQRHRSMVIKQPPPPPGHRATSQGSTPNNNNNRQRSITVHLRDSTASNKRHNSKRGALPPPPINTDPEPPPPPPIIDDVDTAEYSRVASLHQLWNNQVAEKYGVTHPPSFILHSGNKLLSSREEKNFNAFLSAIEKVHLKDHKNVNNLNLVGGGGGGRSGSSSNDEHALLKSVLNNTMLNLHHHHNHEPHHIIGEVGGPSPTSTIDTSLDNKSGKIQLICNDLHNPKSRPDTPDTVSSLEDSSSSSSSAGSSSESPEELTDSEDLSREEVERLAQFTTGCPLTKYSCPPHECPECIRAYYKHYYATSSSASSASSRAVSSSSSSPSLSSSATSSAVASRIHSEAEEEEESDVEDEVVLVEEDVEVPKAVQEEPVEEVEKVLPVKRVEVSVAACLQYTKYSSKVPKSPHRSSHHHHSSSSSSNNIIGTNSNNTGSSRSRHRRHHRSSRQAPTVSTTNSSPPAPPPPLLSLFPQPAPPHHFTFYSPDTVSIDLTNSDVELSIYYHTKRSDSKSSGSGSSSSSSSASSSPDHTQKSHNNNSRQHHHHHHHHHHHEYYYSGNFCSTMPPHHAPWMPYYGMGGPGGLWYPPYQPPLPVAIPRPLMVPRDTKCLHSETLCLIPAHEIKDFTASQPNQRPWVPLGHPDGSRPVAIYTVMCYNVLCDKYATRQLYGYCPSWALNWEYRKKAIMEEIRQYNADIISLQEVETDQFYNFFEPELNRDGYKGIFSPKSRAHTMSESEKKHVDGCAIFYKTAKFTLIKKHLLEFNKLAMSRADGSHDMINRVMTKDNIALAALLETNESIWENGLPPDGQRRQPLLVATCHIHWDPEYCDVKLIQTMMLMSELKNIIEELQTSLRPGATAPDARAIPLLLCGDLNSLPESGVVEYLNTGKVDANHIDFKKFGYEDCLRKLHGTESDKDHFTHGFNLQAAYGAETMPYTNYTFEFKGVIDYIFLSRDFMRPLGVLGPLDLEWFRQCKVLGCPHPHIPSDHLPLLTEIEMGCGPLILPSSRAGPSGGASSGPGAQGQSRGGHRS